MTKEDKEILLKDLCARLPYKVKISIPGLWTSKERIETLNEIFKGDDNLYRVNSSGMLIRYIKPYLFPLSSMTDMQKKEYNILRDDAPTYHYEFGDIVEDTELYDNWKSIDYLNAHHFDFRGLIKEGLAIDATGLNIY